MGLENRGDVTEFGSLNHSPGKRVLNNLKTICLRFWKAVVQRVAVIKHRVNNRCGNVDGTGSFEVKMGAVTQNSTKPTSSFAISSNQFPTLTPGQYRPTIGFCVNIVVKL